MSWYGGYLTPAHALFKNTEPNVDNDYSSNFDFHIVRAGTHVVFPSEFIKKKKKNRLATTWCPPIESLSLFLCVHIKQIEKKRL